MCEFNPEDPCNPNPTICTLCTGDKSNNMFFVNGQCKLDQMTYEQVVRVIEMVPDARGDIQKITSDEILLDLSRTVKLVNEEGIQSEATSDLINRGGSASGTLPFYTVLRGRIDGSIL
jgi:hypothetical protein